MSNFVHLIKEICQEQEISLKSFAGDWVFLLEKDGRSQLIHGYQFGLDLAAVAAVCKDKAAASDLMEHFQIPHVPHWCIMSPRHPEYILGESGSYEQLLQFLDTYGKLVCKDNQGTGGNLVYTAASRKELEFAADRIFDTAPSMAVSPYVNIKEEIRCIVLEGQIAVAFRKLRPAVIGNGKATVQELLEEKLHQDPKFAEALLQGAEIGFDFSHGDNQRQGISYVPKQGEPYVLSWKHNLGQGARAQLLQPDKLPEELLQLVRKVTEAFHLRFVSVDVIRTDETVYQVLEINNGVMMENLAGTGPEVYELVKQVYTKAILLALQK